MRIESRPGGTTERGPFDRETMDRGSKPIKTPQRGNQISQLKPSTPGPLWKTRTQPRTKPVIARDTTCSVSLLTGTICGSKFAIPRHEIPSHGNGPESHQK